MTASAEQHPPAVSLVWDARCQLGEGPMWLADRNELRFVDIKAGKVLTYSPGTGATACADTGGNPSFILPVADGGLLVGSRNSIHRLEGERLGPVVAGIPEPASNRTNDATVDEAGRLWFGTMDDNENEPIGSVWCLERGVLHRAGPQAVVTNGPAVSVGNRFLYHADSGNRTIWRFPLDDMGRLGEGEVFLHLGGEECYPDGIVVDSEDCLWVALWDGWGVRRYAPDGTLLLHVPLPCARVTKIAFGGPDLRTAYVTTARVGLSLQELAEQTHAGGLFAFDAPAPGRILPSVRLD